MLVAQTDHRVVSTSEESGFLRCSLFFTTQNRFSLTMGLHKDFKKLCKSLLANSAFAQTVAQIINLRSVPQSSRYHVIEDYIIRAHGMSGPHSGEDMFREFISWIHNPSVRESNRLSMPPHTYVACCDNWEFVPTEKKATQDNRDKDIVPYPEGCEIIDAGIRIPMSEDEEAYQARDASWAEMYAVSKEEQMNYETLDEKSSSVYVIQRINPFRLMRTRYLRLVLMRYFMEKICTSFAAIVKADPAEYRTQDFPESVIIHIGAESPFEWIVKTGQCRSGHLNHVVKEGESDIFMFHWMKYLEENRKDNTATNYVLRTIDSDTLPIAINTMKQLKWQYKDARRKVVFSPNSYAKNLEKMESIDLCRIYNGMRE
ncbi:MAG TPA: hypothetical protein VEF04_13975, partial [Blastocatellia bacterium]|nr:hypothetical protein [Blastocatellia bacterium]